MRAGSSEMGFERIKIFLRTNCYWANKKVAEGATASRVHIGLPSAGTVGALSQPLAAAGVTVLTSSSATSLLNFTSFLLTTQSFLH